MSDTTKSGQEGEAKLWLFSRTGGPETKDHAEMLAKMYEGWAARHGIRFNRKGVGQAAVIILTFNGDGDLLSRLGAEHGAHRLSVVSRHDPQGRRHTTFMDVATGHRALDEDKRVRSIVLDPYVGVTDLTNGKRILDKALVDRYLAGELELLDQAEVDPDRATPGDGGETHAPG